MGKAKKPTTKKEVFDFRTITSYEKACEKENHDPNKRPDVSMIPEEFRAAIIAVFELFMIFKAINNGWEADYANPNQRKYEVWQWIEPDPSAASGFRFGDSGYGYSGTAARCGSRLCTDTDEKALFIGKQFSAQYGAFFLKNK